MVFFTNYNIYIFFNSGVDGKILKEVGKVSVTADTIEIHSRLSKYHVEARLSKISSGVGLDWATCEALAFGTLMLEGDLVFLSY